MENRPFGPMGQVLPIIGQGTWNMERDDRRLAIAALRAGIDAGMGHIDTAELYGSGEVEDLVGEAIAGWRDSVYLVSKVLPQNASRAGTIQACERTLGRLGCDHLDLYLLHWPGEHPLEETIAAFEDLRRQGKIQAWGLSNFNVSELEQALTIAGEGRITCNQILYHLGERAVEHRVIPWCGRHSIAVVAYSPFGSGRFPSEKSRGGKLLAELAGARGATPRQLALKFLTRERHVFAIPKASLESHARENAAAGDLALSAEELARLEAAFPLGAPREDVPFL